MRFLTLVFYLLVGALAAWFAVRNWDVVTLRLWGESELAIRLPALLFITFLIGVLPLALLQNVSKWRLGRRLRRLERALADARTSQSEAAPPDAAPPPPTAR